MKTDGSVITWGYSNTGGDSSTVREQLADGVQMVTGNVNSFAAVKVDGSVIFWGDPYEDI